MPSHSQPFTILQSVDSTNNYAMGHVHAGMAKHGNIYFSYAQTAGKGQRGKSWSTGDGQNIAMSMVIQPPLVPLENHFSLSIAAALGCCELVKMHTGLDAAIKWPNDIYLGDRKAGGTLIENVIQGSEWPYAIIGIGLNVNQTSFAPELPNPVSLKQLTGRDFDVITLAKDLGQCLMQQLKSLEASGFPKLLEQYNNRLYKRNEQVMLKKENINLAAKIMGVSAQGRLLARHAIEQEFEWGEIEWKPVV